MMRIVILMAILTVVSACTYDFSMADRTEKKFKYVEVPNNFYVWGWIGRGNIDLYKICGSGHIYKMRDHQGIGQLLLDLVTAGLVQLRTVEITCSEPGGQRKVASASLEL